MANIKIIAPDSLIKSLESASNNIVKISDETLKQGATIIENEMRKNLKAAIGNINPYVYPRYKTKSGFIYRTAKNYSRSTGTLLDSLGISEPNSKNSKSSRNIKIGFREPRNVNIKSAGKQRGSRGGAGIGGGYNYLSNALLANMLEYGRSGQDAQPFQKITRRRAMKPSRDRMKAVMDAQLQLIIDRK